MLNKIKNSLIVQTSFLFFISTVIIISVWFFAYKKEMHEIKTHKIQRYIRTVEFLQPMLFRLDPITDEHLEAFAMTRFEGELTGEPIFEKGNKNIGIKLYKIDNNNILKIYNPLNAIVLKDNGKERSGVHIIHTIFFVLLFLQLLLYLKVKSTLSPLSKLNEKLKHLHSGDLSFLQIDSKYEEIEQITTSYNHAMQKLDYLLNIREMLNKIFMHELKTPIAKGMFYLKMPLSNQTNEKLKDLFSRMNEEIDDFARIENLIIHNEKPSDTVFKTQSILEAALNKLDLQQNSNVHIHRSCQAFELKGDKELWVLCFKNIIDNALKYADDKKVSISCTKEMILFKNIGKRLPIDISQRVNEWKIDKNKRHKSSTGYGFGLFIITNIVKVQNHQLIYEYDPKTKEVIIGIKKI